MKAVRFDEYGGIDVLKVVEVPDPSPREGEVLVRVRAAGINPGEAAIRKGLLHERWPATFPSGQGSDFAGIVEAAGAGAGEVKPGDEVIGFTDDRASQAELVVVPQTQLTARPTHVSWDMAGSLHVVGATAWAAVRAVGASPGDCIVVSGAAGGVGSVAIQLARNAGATVIGLASPNHHDWIRGHGATPVAYGDGVADRIREAASNPVDALIDTYGNGYVKLGIDLGVAPERIDTIIDWDAAERYGTKTDANAAGSGTAVLEELAQLIDRGELDIPIAATYPLEQVQEAYRELEERHTLGKIVLHP
jgi:NADPH:quinone reductase-like Zn-dependent oxidoreductase